MKHYTITEYQPGYQPAYLSNGVIGLRMGKFPFERGTVLVNGFFGTSPEKGCEEQAECPWVLGWDCHFGTAALSARPDMATFESQSHDFATGELTTLFRIGSGNDSIRAEVRTWCSRTQPTVIVQETTFTAESAVEFVFETAVELRGCDGRLAYQCRPGRGSDGIALWESRGARSTLGIAYVTESPDLDKTASRRNAFGHEADRQLTNYTIKLTPGASCRIRTVVSLVPGILHDEPHWQAHRMLAIAEWRTVDGMREENHRAWADLWKSRVRIESDMPHIQDAADAAFYYLNSTVHPASPCSIAPFGLGQRRLYSGHVFWDCETFMYPPVLFAQPDAAKAMLDYRIRCLPRAVDNARLQGYRGLQFPWQSGLSGAEVTPFYATGCVIEHHINMDVALAFAQYVYATGDEIFFREKAWPVLQGVAEWIVSRVTKTARGYEIKHVTGIDESRDNVDNSAYTNMAAIVVLRIACEFAARLGYPEPAAWRAIERGMVLPMVPGTNIINQHDGYVQGDGMCSPDTMAGFFPYGYSHSPAVDEATARHHIKYADTYLGMPMLSSSYGVWACQWGERGLARKFFEKGISRFRVDPYHQFSEMSPDAKKNFLGSPVTDAVFLTNPGGFLMALVMGLPGMRLSAGAPETWFEKPVVLPDGWKEIAIDRVVIRGEERTLVARHGAKTQLQR